MHLVEQHIISKNDPRYAAIDHAAFASKNLYNLANYHMRQSFIHTGKYLGYAEVYHIVKQTDAYSALPRKVGELRPGWACEARKAICVSRPTRSLSAGIS